MHQSEMEEQTEVATDPSYVMDDRGNRKLLFKKRSTSSTCAVCCFICMCTLLYYIYFSLHTSDYITCYVCYAII